jgi:hypothetical protein
MRPDVVGAFAVLNPAPKAIDGTLLAFAPIEVCGAAEVLDAVHRTSDAWCRLVDTLDDLAGALNDIDEGRF